VCSPGAAPRAGREAGRRGRAASQPLRDSAQGLSPAKAPPRPPCRARLGRPANRRGAPAPQHARRQVRLRARAPRRTRACRVESLFRQLGLLGAGRAPRTQAGAADARVRADLGKVADRQDGLRRLRRQLPRRRQDERLHPAAARRGARQLQGSHGVGLGPCAARQRARPARVRSPLPRRQQARTPWRAESSQPAPAPDSGPAQRGSGAGGGAAARLQQPACGRAGQRARRPRLCSRVRRAASQCGTDEAQAEGATRCSGPRLHKLPACAPGTLRGWLAWGARQAPSVRRATQPWR